MTEKRFEIVGENFTNVDVTTYIVEYGDGDDDCFELYESKETSQKVCDKLNNILDENKRLRKEIERKEKIIQDKSELVRQQVNVSENLQARINILERALEEE